MRLIRLLSNKNSVVNTVKSSVNENRWDIYAGLCLERRPIIAPQLDAFQRVVLQVNQKFETNKSLLSDHEVKKLKEKYIVIKKLLRFLCNSNCLFSEHRKRVRDPLKSLLM